jgi:hypothetical protein
MVPRTRTSRLTRSCGESSPSPTQTVHKQHVRIVDQLEHSPSRQMLEHQTRMTCSPSYTIFDGTRPSAAALALLGVVAALARV